MIDYELLFCRLGKHEGNVMMTVFSFAYEK